MHSNIAIELLKTLNENEIKNFGNYLKSPYFNKSKVIIKLFDIITKYRPDYTSSVLKKTNLFKKLYPGNNSYNENTLKTRMAELTSLIRDFMTQVAFEKDNFAKQKFLGKELIAKKKYKLAEKIFTGQIEAINKEEFRDSKSLENKIIFQKELSRLYSQINGFEKLLETNHHSGKDIIIKSLIELFSVHNTVVTFSNYFNKEKNTNHLDRFFKNFNLVKFLEESEKEKDEYYPFLIISYHIYLLKTNPGNEGIFYKLKEQLFKYYNVFNKEQLADIRESILTTLYQDFITKDKKFDEEKHNLNKFFLKLDAMPVTEEGYLIEVEFRNIFNTAIGMKDHEWAEDFVNKYHERIHPSLRENSFNFCMAMIEFGKKNFDKSLEHLNKVSFTDIIINLDVRYHTLMIYYELNLLDQVQYSLDSMSHFISYNKNEFPDYLRDWLKLSTKFLNKIINAKLNNTKIDYAIYAEAKSKPAFYNRGWILKKMEELV